MLKLFYLLFLISFFNSQFAYGQTALQLLEQDLVAHIKTIKKDIKIYHYFLAPTSDEPNGDGVKKIHPTFNQKNLRDSWVNYLVSLRAGAFWDLNNTNTSYINAGPGMYSAIDPNSSKEFGESAVVLRVLAGANFLSVNKPLPLKKETILQMLKENMISKAQLIAGEKTLGLNLGLNRNSLKNMVRTENLKFRKAIMYIFSRNNIQFIEYIYQSHLAGFCKIANQSALVFIGRPPLEINQNSNEVLAQLDENYKNSLLFSNYQIEDYSIEESIELDLLKRFRNVLAEIRIKGVIAAKQLIHNNLSEIEIEQLESQSYECVRRY